MKILSITQAIISLLLVVSILMQNRGSGLGGAFGGADMSNYYTKRGMEKFLVYATTVLAVLFIGSAILNVYFSFGR